MSTVDESPAIFDQVVRITHVYLGPAADRFIVRQVQNHLHKDPTDLSREDLRKLVDWIRVAVSFLTDDSELVEEYISALNRLARDTKRKGML